MTKKDYIVFAEYILDLKDPYSKIVVASAVYDIAIRNHSRFDSTKFAKTCGLVYSNGNFYIE